MPICVSSGTFRRATGRRCPAGPRVCARFEKYPAGLIRCAFARRPASPPCVPATGGVRVFFPPARPPEEGSVFVASLAAPTPRKRRSYARLERVIDVPNLIDIQVASFRRFMQDGLRETIDDISPIEDYTGSLAVEFGDYEFEPPKLTIRECREKDQTYQAALHMTVRFVNKTTGNNNSVST